jgi:hypothetical protein
MVIFSWVARLLSRTAEAENPLCCAGGITKDEAQEDIT